MEFLKNKLTFFIFLIVHVTIAQNKLVVYQTKGEVKLKASKKHLYTGTVLKPKSSIIIAEKSSIIFVDKSSNLYEVKGQKSLSFTEVLNYKRENKSKSVSGRYLAYVYKKFLKKEEQKKNYGGVFRGNKKLIKPISFDYFKESTFMNFEWKSIGENYFYLWLIDANNNKVVQKIKINYANSISLNLPFKRGLYKWTITTENYLEENTIFNYFEIVSSKEFKKRKTDSIYEAKKKIELMI